MSTVRHGRRLALVLAVIAMTVSAPGWTQGESWPARPIRMLVPFPPGGAADMMARYLGNGLAKRLNQAVVVENVPGMGGVLSLRRLAHAPADGYTIGLAHVGVLAISPHLYASVGYDPLKDFAPIAQISEYENVLVVNSKSPFRSLGDLLAAARAQPGVVSYGSAGNGSSNHLTAAMLSSMGGMSFNHIPYKGSAAALLGVMAGNVDFMFDVMNTSREPIRAGKLRALAMTGKQRSPEYPDVPTVAETIPGFAFEGWSAIVAPAGTPRDIVQRVSTALQAIIQSPDGSEHLRVQGATPRYGAPEVVDALIRRDLRKFGEVVKQSHVRID